MAGLTHDGIVVEGESDEGCVPAPLFPSEGEGDVADVTDGRILHAVSPEHMGRPESCGSNDQCSNRSPGHSQDRERGGEGEDGEDDVLGQEEQSSFDPRECTRVSTSEERSVRTQGTLGSPGQALLCDLDSPLVPRVIVSVDVDCFDVLELAFLGLLREARSRAVSQRGR